MKKILCSLAMTLIISGCQSTSDKISNWPDINAGPKPTNYEALVKETIKLKLKDPDSASFKNISAPYKEHLTLNGGEDTFVWAVCGLVNAKNSYGGFTGFEAFMVSIVNDAVIHSYIIDNGYSGSRCTSAVMLDKSRL